ncbi:MAG: type III-B CRISPR module RAMP protein Cmr1 [Candidatus Carbobacillus altaicus]|nr:type III-B CRISPR module RAMP protein Cmr1 [Candidatus Carbobacillus altaicus]
MNCPHKPLCKEWKFEALTDIWTGDLSGRSDRLIMTGLLGSIRWWFEVLVRGLEGYACDPTDKSHRCPSENVQEATEAGHHCVVCELFGCTGWGRKFRFEVLTENREIRSNQIKVNETFRLRFTALRPIRTEEWALIDLTMRLISDYGAIGGKTVFKPSDQEGRKNKLHHSDFGLVELKEDSGVERVSKEELTDYIKSDKWRKGNFDDYWASLKNFWFVENHYLARKDDKDSSFNRVIGRQEPKNKAKSLIREIKGSKWLSGKERESKKVFSFKKLSRTYGFIKRGVIDFDDMQKRLMDVWASESFSKDDFKKGEEIIEEIFKKSDCMGGKAE